MSKKKEIKTNAMRFLDKNKIAYNHFTFDIKSDDAKTGVGVAKIIVKDKKQVFKTIVTTAGDGNYFVGVIMCEDNLDLKKLAKEAKVKKIELLPLKDLTKITGYVKGGCSPFAMKKQFPTFIDEKCLNVEKIIISAGKVGEQIEVDYKVLENLLGAKIANITKEET